MLVFEAAPWMALFVLANFFPFFFSTFSSSGVKELKGTG